MRGAVRPFVPGPLVIVNDKLKERRVVGVGVEEGPLTDAEKRQFLPPAKSLAVKREQMEARQRQEAHTSAFGADNIGRYTPPFGTRIRNRAA
jgi:hypothetical protein